MNNPILARELVDALRSRRAVVMQLLPALICSLLVLWRWPTDGRADLGGALSRQVFQLFGYGLLTAIALMVPAFPATAFVRERVHGTLALLLQSPMRPIAIYLGKFGGSLGFVILPLAASLPAAAACYVMGGVSARDQILVLYIVLILATFQYTALGLYISINANSIDGALRTTYGWVLALTVLAPLPYQVLQGKPWGSIVTLASWLRSASPIPAVMETVGHGDIGSQGIVAASGEPVQFAIVALAITVILMTAAILRLRPTLFDRSHPPGLMTEDREASAQRLRRVLFVVDPDRRSALIGPWSNPVLVKEFRCRRFGRSHWLVRLVAGCAVGSLLLTFLSSSAALDWGVGTTNALLVLTQGALIVFLTPGLAAGLISGELEGGGWALLRMTPLSPGTILRGKLLSVVWTLGLILLATLPGYGVMIYAYPSTTLQVVYVIVSLLLTAVFALMLSAAIGSFFSRTAPATVTAYAVLLAICAGPLLIWLGRDIAFGDRFVEQVLMVSPVAAALSVMEVPGFAQYRLVPIGWWITGGAALLALIVLRVRVWQLTRPQ